MIQSIVLKKSKFNLFQAEKKVEEMGHDITNLDETIDYFRFIQIKKIRFKKNSLFAEKFNDDIFIIKGLMK